MVNGRGSPAKSRGAMQQIPQILQEAREILPERPSEGT
jgi:hypothetical protein